MPERRNWEKIRSRFRNAVTTEGMTKVTSWAALGGSTAGEILTGVTSTLICWPISEGNRSRELLPPILYTSKGAGTPECRDTARGLLQYLGHEPVHVEGVIWRNEIGVKGSSPWPISG
ncbi:unnamed protein product [Discosporangium mesarthrocarpum]